MVDPGYLLGRDCTEVGALWQVPANEVMGILIRASFPGCIRTGEVASGPAFGREPLLPGILGPILQRKGLTALGRELLQPINDRSIGLISALSGQLGDQANGLLTLHGR